MLDQNKIYFEILNDLKLDINLHYTNDKMYVIYIKGPTTPRSS